jgi:hypothetical protein
MEKIITLCVVSLSIMLFTGVLQADDWSVPGDFVKIQDAIDDVNVRPGDKILVGPGDFEGAFVDKPVEIKGIGGATISSGPAHSSGLIQGFRLLTGSDGATISHLEFTSDVDLVIMNGAAVDDVTITQCTFNNSIQAISNWSGCGWEISHNNIIDLRTLCGGGIAILVADWTGGEVENNVVSHNTISGTLHVAPGDCGGYAGSGIVLYADFRWGRAGANYISYNRVVKNKIGLVSDNAGLVDVFAIELTNTLGSSDVVTDNAIGFNDLRDTAETNQIALSPTALDNPVNDISRNMGENRGHGLRPSLFEPGGN